MQNFLFSLILVCAIFSGCSSSSKYVANNWRIHNFQTPEIFADSPEHQEIFTDFQQKAKIQFHKDGTYHFDLVSATQEGKWEFDEKNMTLTTTSTEGLVQQSQVLKITADTLILKQETGGASTLMVLVPEK